MGAPFALTVPWIKPPFQLLNVLTARPFQPQLALTFIVSPLCIKYYWGRLQCPNPTDTGWPGCVEWSGWPGWPGWQQWPLWPVWTGWPGWCIWNAWGIIFGMLESTGFQKYTICWVFQVLCMSLCRRRLCHCHCLCLCICVLFEFWLAIFISFQNMYGYRGLSCLPVR